VRLTDTRRALRIVFFGTSDFAVPSLNALITAGHQVLAVVTQPDKPQGRGQQAAPSPVKRAAERHGLPVLQPRRVRTEAFLEKMRALAPDVLALAAFGQIIPQALLDLPPLGPINVHGSLLPAYRGAAPIQRAIMAGETVTGVTTMWMDAKLDTGDMMLSASLAIDTEETAGTLTPKLAILGANLLVETLDGLAAGTLQRLPQDNSRATLAPALLTTDGAIDWKQTAVTIANLIRGVSPKPGAYTAIHSVSKTKIPTNGRLDIESENAPEIIATEVKEKRIKVWTAVPIDQTTEVEPGVVLALQKNPAGITVASGSGTILLLTEVQPDNGRRMPAVDWARGQRLSAGVRFS